MSTQHEETPPGFLQQHSRSILGLFIAVLMVHDVFGTHGFIAMRRTRNEIQRVQKDLDRLNSENVQLNEEVKALKTDPHYIEKLAREGLGLSKSGEIIIKIPPSQPQAQDPAARP